MPVTVRSRSEPHLPTEREISVAQAAARQLSQQFPEGETAKALRLPLHALARTGRRLFYFLAALGLAATLHAHAHAALAADFTELPLNKTVQQFSPDELGGIRLITFAAIKDFTPVAKYSLHFYGESRMDNDKLLTEIQAYIGNSAHYDHAGHDAAETKQVNYADCSGQQLILGTSGTGERKLVILAMATRIRSGKGKKLISEAEPARQRLQFFILTSNDPEETSLTPLYFYLINEMETSEVFCEPEQVRRRLKKEAMGLALPEKMPSGLIYVPR
jgi:hypothetical protein